MPAEDLGMNFAKRLLPFFKFLIYLACMMFLKDCVAIYIIMSLHTAL